MGEVNSKCQWSREEFAEEGGAELMYETKCGGSFLISNWDSGLVIAIFKYCPFCAKEIERSWEK